MPNTCEYTSRANEYSPNHSINNTILWLLELGLPPLPIAPWHSHAKGSYYNNAKLGEPPKAKFTGKNPSFMSRNGHPILVNHRLYQHRLPGRDELKRWFQDKRTGIATMGGWRNIVWVDIDAKLFPSIEACEAAVTSWIERNGLGSTYIERTHRGGYHVALRVSNAGAVPFTRFRFADGADRQGDAEANGHAGEVLNQGYPIVMAPTLGTEGRYRCLHRGTPLKVESLEAVGVLPLHSGGGVEPVEKSSTAFWFRTISEELKAVRSIGYSRPPLLNKLMRQQVLELMFTCHLVGQGERSDVLVTVAHEAIGWQNWLRSKGYPFPLPDAVTFIFQVGEQIGLDQARIERVLNSASNGVPIAQSMPGIHYFEGDAGCEQRLRRSWR